MTRTNDSSQSPRLSLPDKSLAPEADRRTNPAKHFTQQISSFISPFNLSLTPVLDISSHMA
jgi:hypothetical protein